MQKEEFLHYYSRLSAVELLKVLQEKEKYQAEAIEAASEILASRNYSTEELHKAHSEIASSLIKKKHQKEKIDHAKNNVNLFIDEHLSFNDYTPEKILNVFCIVLFVYTLFTFFAGIKSFTWYLGVENTIFFIELLQYLLQFVLIYLLYRRSNWGWIGLTSIFINFSISNIASVIFYFYYQSEFFFIVSSPYRSLFNFLFYTSVVWFLNIRKINSQFAIEKWGRIATIVVAAIVSFTISFALAFF